jgi:hypothetical protein
MHRDRPPNAKVAIMSLGKREQVARYGAGRLCQAAEQEVAAASNG